MSTPAPTPHSAWQPLTFGGVAAFARASWRRTFAFALTGATLCGLLIVAGFRFGWLPVIDAAVNELPETGEIRRGELQWANPTPQVLAQSAQLLIAVNAQSDARLGDESDLRVELRGTECVVCGWLGCTSWAYPAGWIIAVNRPEVLPAWGAWRPFVFWGVFAGGTVWVLVNWLALSVVGAAPLRLLAFYCDRDLPLGAAARLLLVAWIPGGLFFGLALFLYGTGQLHPAAMALIGLGHVLLGVVYAVGALSRVQRVSLGVGAPKGNPFHAPPTDRQG
jgi:hypothetical protein